MVLRLLLFFPLWNLRSGLHLHFTSWSSMAAPNFPTSHLYSLVFSCRETDFALFRYKYPYSIYERLLVIGKAKNRTKLYQMALFLSAPIPVLLSFLDSPLPFPKIMSQARQVGQGPGSQVEQRHCLAVLDVASYGPLRWRNRESICCQNTTREKQWDGHD